MDPNEPLRRFRMLATEILLSDAAGESEGNAEVRVQGVLMSPAAAECVNEAGVVVAYDVSDLRHGRHTPESLLAHCLKGADADRIQGWRDYIEALKAEGFPPPREG